ncbi:tetratricopeptide repeat protein [Salmonirosea aquatica]|uniref:Tetratricopeptide repeat protein n=1 Tax=Salmonirosea aquatica TaxID=2654236 RepID=A0A7C9BH69_9BACT|nr:hypothetical protein [Cytophagaceae bacterium SJW1-29]
MIRYRIILLTTLASLLLSSGGMAQAFLQQIDTAAPDDRVLHLLHYYDTCRAFRDHSAYAIGILRRVNEIGERKHDERLLQYARYLDEARQWDSIPEAHRVDFLLTLARRATDEGDEQTAAIARHTAGQMLFETGEYGKAFEYLLAANKAFRKIGYSRVPPIGRYLYELASDYYHFNEYEKAIQLLKEASRYPSYNAKTAIQTRNTLGMAYTWLAATRDSALYVQAERSYQRARQVAGYYGDSLWVGIATGNLANVYENQHQWAKALQSYLTSYRIGLKFGGQSFSPSSEAISIAGLYLRLGRPDSCLHYLRRSLILTRLVPGSGNRFENEYFQKNYYDAARRYYWAIGDARQAYAYFDSLSVVEKRISKRQKTDQISMVQKKLLIQKHQSEVEGLEARQQAQQRQFWIVAILLALLAGLFIRLYYLSRLRRRQERVIGAEKEKSLRLEKQIVETELQRAQADLSGYIENLRQKEALIDSITAQLERLTPASVETNESRSLLATRQNLIDSSLLTNDDWDEFRRRFERVHPGFFWQLKTYFSDISPAEERLLALSRLHLDTRQMSRMLGISPHSIRMTRYRLRKKIGAEAHELLSEFLGESAEDSVTS